MIKFLSIMSFYESLINSIEDGIILFNLEEKIIYVNKNAEEILYKSIREIKDKLFNDIYPEEGVITPLIRKAVQEKRSFSGDNETIKLDNEIKLDFYLSPFYLDEKIDGVVLSIRKSRKLPLNEDLNFDSLILILSTISHEIKNPLTGIKASAQLLKPMVNKELTEYIDMIIKESDRLNRIIQDYLNISKKPIFNEINLHEIIEIALKLLENQVKEKNIYIQKEYDTSLPIIKGDESKLLQVFINIIKNAIDSIKNDYGFIKLKSHPSNEYILKDGHVMHWAIIDIEDNGVGINRNDLEKIFTPFHTTKKDGVGLGLAISKKIVHDHRGMIKVKSTKDKGTVFSIYMPLPL